MRNGNRRKTSQVNDYFFVLILPMRNGNIDAVVNKIYDDATVLILPMRNGNPLLL